MGVLERFDRVFDLEVYRRRRFDYLMLLRGRSSDSFIREIFEFSRQPEAQVPGYVALFHSVWPVISLPYRAVRTANRWAAGTPTRR
jgi:hypothetical protein